MYALMLQVTLVATALFDLDARETGRLLVSMMLAMVITSPIAGRSPIGSAHGVALAGSVGAGGSSLSPGRPHRAGEGAAPIVLLGVGLGSPHPPLRVRRIAVGSPLAGTAAGIGSTMRYLGGITGVAVISVMLDVRGTRAEVVSDHRTLMTVFAGALLIGLVCAALLPGRIAVAQSQAEDVQSGI